MVKSTLDLHRSLDFLHSNAFFPVILWLETIRFIRSHMDWTAISQSQGSTTWPRGACGSSHIGGGSEFPVSILFKEIAWYCLGFWKGINSYTTPRLGPQDSLFSKFWVGILDLFIFLGFRLGVFGHMYLRDVINASPQSMGVLPTRTGDRIDRTAVILNATSCLIKCGRVCDGWFTVPHDSFSSNKIEFQHTEPQMKSNE